MTRHHYSTIDDLQNFYYGRTSGGYTVKCFKCTDTFISESGLAGHISKFHVEDRYGFPATFSRGVGKDTAKRIFKKRYTSAHWLFS